MSSRMPAGDTSAEAQAVLIRLYAAMPAAAKLRRVTDLTLAANSLALEGLRLRFPDEPDGTLLLRLARTRLGAELVDCAYTGSREP